MDTIEATNQLTVEKKVEAYKAIAHQITVETGALGETEDGSIRSQVVIDHERGHYLAFFNSWHESTRTYGCYLHLDVEPDGKVWVQHDGTDLRIAEQLVDHGIPPSDIVLGFQSPLKRPDTGYAIG